MIVVYSNAGLANRMFHYSLYKALEVKAIAAAMDTYKKITDKCLKSGGSPQ